MYQIARIQALVSESRASLIPLYRLVRGGLLGPADLSEALSRNAAEALILDRLKANLDWSGLDLPQSDGRASTTEFLFLLASLIEKLRPRTVVEFGAGLSTLVIARSLMLHGNGRLVSYEHKEGFAELSRRRLRALGLAATVHSVPLEPAKKWGHEGKWYAPTGLPEEIDLVVIDGPPAYFVSGTRGAAAPVTFPRLSNEGFVLLDDAKRAGEQAIAQRWKLDHPTMAFHEVDTRKGALIGHRLPAAGGPKDISWLAGLPWNVGPSS
jgi:predicted O-methyltransferase YrrM